MAADHKIDLIVVLVLVEKRHSGARLQDVQRELQAGGIEHLTEKQFASDRDGDSGANLPVLGPVFFAARLERGEMIAANDAVGVHGRVSNNES